MPNLRLKVKGAGALEAKLSIANARGTPTQESKFPRVSRARGRCGQTPESHSETTRSPREPNARGLAKQNQRMDV